MTVAIVIPWFKRIRSGCDSRDAVARSLPQPCNDTRFPPFRSTSTRCGTDAATHGLSVKRIFIGGGGARSALWLQIHADILKKPVHLTRESESCALGSAMPAAVAAGFYRDFADAALAHLAERENIRTLFTLDRRDFSIIRLKRIRTLRLIPDIQ